MGDLAQTGSGPGSHHNERDSLRVFCVTHESPLVPEHLADFLIGIGDYHPAAGRGVHISALDQFWDRMRPYAYGAAGNYVIPHAIDALQPARFTGVFSQRKMIVRNQIGVRSEHSIFYHDIDEALASSLPREEILPRDGFDFLIPVPIKCKQSVVTQYIHDHNGIDLFDYISMAVNLGVLQLDEAQAFACEEYFVLGGCESGVYPTVWVKPVLESLARLGREFVTRRQTRIATYNTYQVRAVGFLAERLGSYLLLAELRRRYPAGIPMQLCGYPCVIVPPGGTYLPAVVEQPSRT